MRVSLLASLLPLVLSACASGRMVDPGGEGNLDGGGNPKQDQKVTQKDVGGSKKDGSTVKLDTWIPKPDLPRPDKAVPKPDLAKLDKALPKPDKAVPKPDKAVPKPDLTPTCPVVAFVNGFEAGNGGLKAWGDWQWGTYAFAAGPNCDSSHKEPASAHSGAKMWGTRLNDCHSPANNAANTCNNVNPNDDSILRLEVKLPPACKTVTLSYWEYNDYFLDFDWAEVRVDGNVVLQNCQSAKVVQGKWLLRTVDLSAYAGKFIGIEWHFMATGVINYSGWYIDDIKVEAK